MNVIITGTSRGIGFQLAQVFAHKGHQVLALSRNSKPIEELNNEQITAFPFDIGDEVDLDRVSDFVASEWDEKVHILINNAGTLLNKSFADTTVADFEQIYKVNVFGVVAITRRIVPFMPKSGHVVSISSMGGVQGSMKFPGLAAYSSSKGAVITLTELLAEEYKENGPAFNALALGAVQTEMLEEAFPGFQSPLSPEEMANYIFDFATTGNKFYNGKVLQVSSTTP